MIASGATRPTPTAGMSRSGEPWRSRLLLLRLFLISRQVPLALAVLAACGVALRIALELKWIQGTDTLAQQIPLIIEAGAATAITVTTRNPFGESERTADRWLPYLRCGTALALTAAAVAAFAAGSAAAGLPGGEADVLRNVAGLTGIGLTCAALLGGIMSWACPLAYTVIAEYALTASWHTAVLWPARPPHDLPAALCAGAVFLAGATLITLRGTRETADE
jgi:hypothetical protein